MRKLPLAVLISALLAGCATTDYVDQRVTATDVRIAALVEELAEAKRATAATQAAQDSWLVVLQSGMERGTANQDKLAARVAEAEQRQTDQRASMTAVAERLNRHEEGARQTDAALRDTRDLAARLDNRATVLEQRLTGVEQTQAGSQSGLQAQLDGLTLQGQQLTARLVGTESLIAQADSRISQTAEVANKASAQSEEALALAKGLGARLELVAPMLNGARAAAINAQPAEAASQPAAAADQGGGATAQSSLPASQPVMAVEAPILTTHAMLDEEARRLARQALEQSTTALEMQTSLQARLDAQAQPATPALAVADEAALKLAEQALAAANQNKGQLDALSTRVEDLASASAAAPAPVATTAAMAPSASSSSGPVVRSAPAMADARLDQVEQRLSRVEDSVSQQGQRLAGVENGVAQAGADGRQLEAKVDGLAQSHDKLAEEQRQAASLLATLQAQLQEAQARQQAQDVALSQLSAMAREALERALAAGQLAQGKFVYEMVLSESGYHFALNSAELRPETIAALDDLVLRLNALNADVFLEIQGHTDSSGPTKLNLDLAQRRALAVRDYLNRKGHVPLHRMSTIALGDSKPVASNDTREGRRQNRRVVIEVLR